jgi:hypothetical protein
MEAIRRKENYKVIEKSNKRKSIHVYMSILGKEYYKLPYNEIVKILNDKFNTDFTLADVNYYFSPNFEEDKQDLLLQLKNLHL